MLSLMNMIVSTEKAITENGIVFKRIDIKQTAYADDLTGAGKLRNLKEWWENVVKYGPFIGYFAKPSKS